MPIDVTPIPHSDLETPRFLRAPAQARRLKWWMLTIALGVAASLLAAGTSWVFMPSSAWPTLLCNVAACLLLLVAALQAAYWPARWRALAKNRPSNEPAPTTDAPLGWYDRLVARVGLWAARQIHRIGIAPLWLTGWCLLALLLVNGAWNLSLLPNPGQVGMAGKAAIAMALLFAFGLVVIERHLAHETAAQWPEALSLLPFFRVAIAGLLIAALCVWFNTPERLWPVRVAALLGLLPALVAVELLMRALASVFTPHHPHLEPKTIAASMVGGLLQWPPRPLHSLQAELHSRFGIDLRQIWAFAYIRRAALPLALAVLALGWLLSGLSQVPMAGRGVYERFGQPIEVVGPGLHLGLPWPLGRMVPVENGLVHELATAQAGPALDPDSLADGPAPASADRLWDATHARDNTQVIASGGGNRQNFQVVNMDVRFVYRVGLSDADALAATYQVAELPTLIRDTASRVLVHTLASRTLDGLLGAERIGLAEQIGTAVQDDLRQASSGVEILATVIEAIHPPAGAANAYHGVQAAQINAQALVSRERGAAAESAAAARLDAFDSEVQAQASARELLTGAQASARLFAADREAYAGAGQAFVFEHYLTRLGQGLGQAQVLVLDHRLGGTSAPTLDLRSFLAPVDPAPPRPVR